MRVSFFLHETTISGCFASFGVNPYDWFARLTIFFYNTVKHPFAYSSEETWLKIQA